MAVKTPGNVLLFRSEENVVDDSAVGCVHERPMSALGHKRTLERLYTMSALPPKADIVSRELDVRFVPKADIGPFVALPAQLGFAPGIGERSKHGRFKFGVNRSPGMSNAPARSAMCCARAVLNGQVLSCCAINSLTTSRALSVCGPGSATHSCTLFSNRW